MDNSAQDRLRDEFCPPIDSALFFAIVSDYDLSDEDAITQLRHTLRALRDAAALELELETGFDPSASGSSNVQTRAQVDGPASDVAESHPESTVDEDSTSHGTDSTSVSQSLSNLDLLQDVSASEAEEEDRARHEFGRDLDILDVDRKQELLKEMFPSLKQFSINHTLKKCQDNYSKAVEELLNQVFLEEVEERGEERLLPKGIDGFAQAGKDSRGRNVKGRKQKFKQVHEERAGEDDRSSVKASKWETAQKDVDFLSCRTNLPRNTISSLYHTSGTSVPGTLRAILDLERANDKEILSDSAAVIQANAIDLGQEFPTIPAVYLETLIRLTHPSTASAHELANALTEERHPKASGKIEIITRLPPIDLSDSDSAVIKRATAHPPTPNHQTSISTASTLANSYGVARDTAFTQASAAYRKGKSKPLMGAAAGYYSSMGRDYDAKVKQYRAAAADALVEGQSSGSELDLHGVSVKDATRIASAKVATWWAGLGDARYVGGASTGRASFKIVTGVGRHSEGGKGRLGPAVGRMLLREGWRVEIGEGVLLVTGLARGW
ncbi:MAG: hypothetical protein M1837_002389 [Sclerophora amabilis]|nr:MAG: hypothetical protein M1837_002389 [Sclerophora amabilis]